MTEIAEVGLKACPLCQSEADLASSGPSAWTITCEECGLHLLRAGPKEVVTAVWNLRHGDSHNEALQPDPRVSALVEALEDVTNPIHYLRKYAERQGRELDGHMVHRVGNTLHFVQEIARKALAGVSTHD